MDYLYLFNHQQIVYEIFICVFIHLQVVYGLNTRGEELESQLTALKESEDKLRTINTQLEHRCNHFKNKVRYTINFNTFMGD